ncbi:MAG: ankyrin repeat domain-containing protein, partial [Nitrosopumilus sp.]
MKAKFVNEDIKDFLKPKSEEEIKSSMGSLNPNKLLIQAAENGFLPGVKKAIERGADVHTDEDEALRHASAYGHYNIVALLLDNGADIHAIHDQALRSASLFDHSDVVELLKKYMEKDETNIWKKIKAKFVNEDIKDFLKPKSEEEIMASIGDLSPNKLLSQSAEMGFLYGVKRALERGANIHAWDDWALRWAS